LTFFTYIEGEFRQGSSGGPQINHWTPPTITEKEKEDDMNVVDVDSDDE
jgi:hypothetical protein